MKAFLKSIHIENYLSLRDVTLPFKPLTVLVGPNASGKSNVLGALRLLNRMMTREELPSVDVIRDSLWAGEGSHIAFQLQAEVGKTSTVYELGLAAEVGNPSVDEKLSVKEVQVISIRSGEGVVQDENSENETPYRSSKLALKSAGDYGHKPITSALTGFIKAWKFYNFRPEPIRKYLTEYSLVTKGLSESPQLNRSGFRLPEVLSYWHKNTPERFHNVSESLEASTNFRIDQRTTNGELELCLLEGYKNPIPLADASDGTLRLIAYYTLLNLPKLPPLIAIEEPERNLHPGALTDIAKVLEQIAERSQVIITTHSSQLLDAFNLENLSDSLGILLLRNLPGRGTEVLNLENIRKDRAALDGWMTDFGIGSAIFESELLQDLMEEPVCQP